MSELLWTCDQGAVFSSETNGVRLLIERMGSGDGFRYQLLRPAGQTERQIPLASGHRGDLREAIAAAERTARAFVPPLEVSAGERPGAERSRYETGSPSP